MKTIAWLSELSKNDIPTVGGKGANLAEMFNAKFPVPEAFIVTAQAYFDFIKRNKIDELIKEYTDDLDVEDTKSLDKASDIIKDAIENGEMSNDTRAEIVKSYNALCKPSGIIPADNELIYVAVRSSATAEDLPNASFAGQQATFLNQKGQENVVKAVQNCWASLFEARAIYYRQQNGFDHLKVGIAVPVQKMVQSDISGVMFTLNPVTNDDSKIEIEAAYGLGEAVVSGSLTPDRYIVDKNSLKILERFVAPQTWKYTRSELGNQKVDVHPEEGKKQKLADNLISGLARYGKEIEKHYNALQDIEWAVEKGKIYIVQSRPVTTFKKQIEKVAERAESGKVIVKGLSASPGKISGPVRIIKDFKELYKVKKGDVLVTEMTSPDFVPAMEKAVAVITNSGGATSHAAIVSRELGIPCIVGSGNATEVLEDGEIVTVDATSGVVYKGVESPSKIAETLKSAEPIPQGHIVTATKVYVNLGEPQIAEKLAQRDVDGIGLFRAEFLMAELGVHPKKMIADGKRAEFVDKLVNGMKKMVSAFSPRPVVYRANDFKTNEYRSLKGGDKFEPQENNPMIGYRGCFRYLKDPDVFKMELEAIKKVRAQGFKNLWLMIPFVRTPKEFREVKRMVEQSGLLKDRDFKLWIMVEVPGAVLSLDELIKEGIDGVSIGSNDLTQLILGVDRDNTTMASEFDEREPAVMKAIKMIIDTCRKAGITCSVCGQAPSEYPDFTESVVRWGITSVSVNPDMIEKTRALIASVERKILLDEKR